MTIKERLYTAADLAAMSDDGVRRELVRGEIREMSPVKQAHAILTTYLIALLYNYIAAHDLGQLNNEGGYRLADNPDTVRAPDIAFIGKSRIPPLADGYFELAPDLAIEVISPSNSADEMNEKVADYFAAGVQQVWLFYPKTKTIQVYRSLKQVTILDVNDVLDGAALLPGFSVAVQAVFAVLDSSAGGRGAV